MKLSFDTAFTRIFIFSIILTLVVSIVAWGLFFYLAAKSTATYQAHSMIAKYQLIEFSLLQNQTLKVPFEYLVKEQPVGVPTDLPSYYQTVKQNIQRYNLRATHIEARLDNHIYLWLKSNELNKWIALRISPDKNVLSSYTIAFVVFTLLLVVLLSFIFARTLSRPLVSLAAVAESISTGATPNISTKFWPVEAKLLADTLSQAAIKLKRNNLAKEEMLLGISHDLRTPLSRTRLAVEFLYKHEPPLVDGIVDDIEEMNSIVEQFISYAREGKTEAFETKNVNDIVRQESSKFKGIQLALAQDFWVQIKPLAIKRLVSNLISNAIKHGVHPVNITTKKVENFWFLVVEDSGLGIPEHQIDQVTKPFITSNQPDAEGNGGLGLSIVEQIVSAHGGSLRLHNLHPAGFRVEIAIPLSLI